jgi:hypothetical protein
MNQPKSESTLPFVRFMFVAPIGNLGSVVRLLFARVKGFGRFDWIGPLTESVLLLACCVHSPKAIIIKTSAETMESFFPSILLDQLGELLNEPPSKKDFRLPRRNPPD